MKRYLLPLLLALTFAFPAIAQETVEPAPTVEVTPDVTEVAPVEPAPEPEQPPQDESIWAGLARYGLAVLAGIGIGVTTALGIVSRIKNDKATLDAIEWAGRNISPEAIAEIRKLAMLLRDAGEVIDKVTDGKENVVA